jgi:hypothetical protein
MCSRLRSFIAITCSHSSGPKTVLRQVKHRSAKVRAPRSGGPKKCPGSCQCRGRRIQGVRAIRLLHPTAALCRQSECHHSLALSFLRPTVNNELSSALRLASEPVPKSQQRASRQELCRVRIGTSEPAPAGCEPAVGPGGAAQRAAIGNRSSHQRRLFRPIRPRLRKWPLCRAQ